MSSALSQLPKVSYIKLVDVWLTGCLVFVFGGFLEYALVNKLATDEKKQEQHSLAQVCQGGITFNSNAFWDFHMILLDDIGSGFPTANMHIWTNSPLQFLIITEIFWFPPAG